MSYVTVRNDDRLKGLLKEIFTDEFMQQHTNFESFTYFCYSSAVITNWEADPMVYDDFLLNRFVQESTEFDTFDNMVRAATDARFGREMRKEQ